MANTKILVTGATGGYRSNYREDTFGNEGAGKSARARRRCSSIATERPRRGGSAGRRIRLCVRKPSPEGYNRGIFPLPHSGAGYRGSHRIFRLRRATRPEITGSPSACSIDQEFRSLICGPLYLPNGSCIYRRASVSLHVLAIRLIVIRLSPMQFQ